MPFLRFRLGAVFCLCLLACLAVRSSPVPTGKPARYPDWWFTRDVVRRLPAYASESHPLWPNHYPAADDFGVVNLGQLKHIAIKAAEEMNARLPGGTGPALAAYVGSLQVAPGLQGTYFSNTLLSGQPVVVRNESVDFDWGSGSPASQLPDNTFSARWTGYLTPFVSGSYRLAISSDDGCRLWFGDQLLINDWGDRGTSRSVSPLIPLQAGHRYAIQIEYYENHGYATSSFEWKTPGQADYTSVPLANLTSLPAAFSSAQTSFEAPAYALAYRSSLLAAHDTVSPSKDDYTVANLGQLKAVARKFYDRLVALHIVAAPPWANSSSPADDYAVANLGQLKNLFAFDFSNLPDTNANNVSDAWEYAHGGALLDLETIFRLKIDEDNDGLHDGWELHYFGQLANQGPSDDSDGDGLDNALEANLRLDPTQAYVYQPLVVTRSKIPLSTSTGDAFVAGYERVTIHNPNPAGIIHYSVDFDASTTPPPLTLASRIYYEGNHIELPPLPYVRISTTLYVKDLPRKSGAYVYSLIRPTGPAASLATVDDLSLPADIESFYIYRRFHEISVGNSYEVTFPPDEPHTPDQETDIVRELSYSLPYWLVRPDPLPASGKVNLYASELSGSVDYSAFVSSFSEVGRGYIFWEAPYFDRRRTFAGIIGSAVQPSFTEFLGSNDPLGFRIDDDGNVVGPFISFFDGAWWWEHEVSIAMDETRCMEMDPPIFSPFERTYFNQPIAYALPHYIEPTVTFIGLGDTDEDGVPDLYEYGSKMDLHKKDTDGDGFDDKYELLRSYLDPLDASDKYMDADGDGVSDQDEIRYLKEGVPSDSGDGLPFHVWDPLVNHYDSDRDGISDYDEHYQHVTNLWYFDTDGDGIPDPIELIFGTDPLVATQENLTADTIQTIREGWQDFNHDGMPDSWAIRHGISDRHADPDHDGLENELEWRYQTDPNDSDSDNDQIPDKFELDHGLDPTNPSDGQELAAKDSDADGLSDRTELMLGTDPFRSDTDNDGLSDSREVQLNTDPKKADTDNDGIPDGWEVTYNLNPRYAPDADSSYDGDNLTALWEYRLGLDPTKRDSDNDGILDDDEDFDNDGIGNWYEISRELDPLRDADFDNDGMPDSWEYAHALSPTEDGGLDDSDGDRIPDLVEYLRGSDPADVDSVPEFTYEVDPLNGNNSDSDRVFATIQEAIDAASVYNWDASTSSYHYAESYAIIYVHAGIYHEQLTISGAPVVILGELGAASGPVTIDRWTGDETPVVTLQTTALLDGFIISRPPGNQGPGLRCEYGARQRLVNCVIRNHSAQYGAALQNHGARVELIHCTLIGNHATGGGRGFSSESGTTRLQNSIVWGNSGALPEIYPDATSATITTSIVYGGALSVNPLLTPAGWLKSTTTAVSPAINRAGVKLALVSRVDIHGEPRDADGFPDLGADEYRDVNGNQDGDGVPDWAEASSDDGDGLTASDEYLIHGTNPFMKDTDGDGLSDDAEINQHQTNPLSSDSDGDGLPDAFEVSFGYNPLDPTDGGLAGGDDSDGDGLTNAQEASYGTDPGDSDSDDDGLLDGEEIALNTFPRKADSDLDGLSDGDEVNVYGTNPLKADSDLDGLRDGWEVDHELDPKNPADGANVDSDGDGITNLLEYKLGFHPRRSDSDGDSIPDNLEDRDADGLPDFWEQLYFDSPIAALPTEDTDNDSLTNLEEYTLGTDPRKADSDDDHIPDGWEVSHKLDPKDPADADIDCDSDGLKNLIEYQLDFDPWKADTDGNSVSDGEEDRDHDGLTDAWEQTYFGSPTGAVVDEDTDNDLIPDAWELSNGLDPRNPNDKGTDLDGDGLSNLAEFQQGSNPNDYYNGATPTITVIEGSGQAGPPGHYLPNAFTVRVTDGAGKPLSNAPVTFTSGTGGFARIAKGAATVGVLTVRTNAQGLAWVYWQL